MLLSFTAALAAYLNSLMVMNAQLPALPVPKYYVLAVPPEADTSYSTRGSDVPFGRWMSGFRYQQVYSASLFTNLPPSGGFIYAVYFRQGHGGLATTGWTNTVVRMSTTRRDPGHLSPTFDANVGTDVLTVLSDIAGSFNGNPNLGVYWDSFAIRTPFFYNPAEGNLLLEIRGGPRRPSEQRPELDPYVYAEVTQAGFDATTSIAAEGMNAVEAQVTNPFGLVTLFVAAPFPHIDVTPTTTEIVLSWPSYPGPNRLQYRDSLDAKSGWKDYTDQPMSGGFFANVVEIPRASFKARRYFRVFWNSPQASVPNLPLEISVDPLIGSPAP